MPNKNEMLIYSSSEFQRGQNITDSGMSPLNITDQKEEVETRVNIG